MHEAREVVQIVRDRVEPTYDMADLFCAACLVHGEWLVTCESFPGPAPGPGPSATRTRTGAQAPGVRLVKSVVVMLVFCNTRARGEMAQDDMKSCDTGKQ